MVGVSFGNAHVWALGTICGHGGGGGTGGVQGRSLCALFCIILIPAHYPGDTQAVILRQVYREMHKSTSRLRVVVYSPEEYEYLS